MNVRSAYDRVAGHYADELAGELRYKPLDRALLSVLVDDVAEHGGGPVADLGGGPGHVASFLAGVGAESLALDLSPAMAWVARHRLGQSAVAGSLTSLPLPDGALGGAVAFYSLIHLDDNGLAAATRELARVLRPGGVVLVAFHIGDFVRHLEEWFDQDVDAGLEVEARLERGPYPQEAATRRAYILARRRDGR